jgi:hypothetical protein
VTLGLETAGRVDDPLATVGVVAIVDNVVGLTLGREAETLVGDKLVGGKAVVELNDLDVLGTDTGELVCLGGGAAGHVGAGKLDTRVLVVELGGVGGDTIASHLDGAVLEAVGADKVLGSQDGAGTAVRSRRAHGESELAGNLAGGADLCGGRGEAELRVGVARRVLVVLSRDLPSVLGLGAVALVVLKTSSTKDATSTGARLLDGVVLRVLNLGQEAVGALQRRDAVLPGGAERSGSHLFETESESALGLARLDSSDRRDKRR